MHVTAPDIEFLVNFLNCDVEKIRKRSTILTDPWPHWPTEKVRKTQADVCFALTEIIAPDLLIPGTWDRALREQWQRTVIDKYYGDPTLYLRRLLDTINKEAADITPPSRLRLSRILGKSGTLHLRGFSWHLQKIEGGSFRSRIYRALANILANDELFLLGLCRVCRKYFGRKREWQMCCSPECKKKYDNKLAAERKVLRSRKRTKGGEWKEKFRNMLSAQGFLKRLDVSERHRKPLQLLSLLERTNSRVSFLSRCEPRDRKMIERYQSEYM